ncbi:MAG: T9SS type A sorting domain-containing protein [Chitinophagaceae bacterium]
MFRYYPIFYLNTFFERSKFDCGDVRLCGSIKYYSKKNKDKSKFQERSRILQILRVTIDWNHNGNIADDTTKNGALAFSSGSGVTGSPVTVTIPVGVPHSISPNYKTRLVVSDAPVSFADFGNIFANGEIEDYQAPAVILPIYYGTTTATVKGCSVLISFETYAETPGGRYVIERSSNNIEWNTVTTIQSKGVSGVNQKYSYEDNMPYNGASFYRVREVTAAGINTVSSTMVVTVQCYQPKIRVFPNPTTGNVYVTLPNQYQGAGIELFNKLGQVVISINSRPGNSGNVVLNTTGLPRGIYVLQIKTPAQKTYTERITVL